MKMKSFAMLAGLLLASAAYIAPALADEAGSADQSMQNVQPDNGVPNQGNMQNAPSQNDSSMNNVGNSDEGSPDTATGDDDY